MENASKALIMAASVILGVMLFSLMIMMFRRAARVDESYENNQTARTLELNNSKYEQYNTNTNTILDLISLCNLAYSNNVECYYDMNRAIKIEISINGVKFVIPNKWDEGYQDVMFVHGGTALPATAYRAGELGEQISPTDFGYGKNRIWKGNTPISIYDLASKSLYDLGISGDAAAKTEKLSKTHYGTVSYYYTDRFGNQQEATKAITTYKYYFKCTGMTYHQVTGRIATMTFENVENEDSEFLYGTKSQYYWHPEWD